MGVVQLNRILGINLGVSDNEEVYDLCKSTDGNSYYLQLRVGRAAFITALFSPEKVISSEKRLEDKHSMARAG
ncbi:hypothetical protein AAC387_Pa01g0539 [Persea americana]